ncbi:MAG TPA: hypothetical protein VIM12_11055 [Noviherbaspirillum sp.]|jgi:hypothetical protein|uniref:hypothetical protein n=1 Tax=Noviherbaspirillum sp. TaxID=1926288 RepID=UPI002F9412A7
MKRRWYITILFGASILITSERGVASASDRSTGIPEKRLALDMKRQCARVAPSREDLAKFLAQYDPTSDPRADVYDESSWTNEEIAELRDDLVEFGFIYPNDEPSVITWMDFDMDGNCDFTATVGIGGMRSVQRMMLFRGIGGGAFHLVDAHISYMEVTVTVVPYVPVAIKGETLPVLVLPSGGRVLQWNKVGQSFDVCEAAFPKDSAEGILASICANYQDLVRWTEKRLPNGNEQSSWRKPQE